MYVCIIFLVCVGVFWYQCSCQILRREETYAHSPPQGKLEAEAFSCSQPSLVFLNGSHHRIALLPWHPCARHGWKGSRHEGRWEGRGSIPARYHVHKCMSKSDLATHGLHRQAKIPFFFNTQSALNNLLQGFGAKIFWCLKGRKNRDLTHPLILPMSSDRE